MAGRPKIYDEGQVLDEAVKVFWEKGYANASADDLLKSMGIGKGSFYLAYKGGKQELFEKTMKRVVDLHFAELRNAIHTCNDPVALIKGFFMSLVGAKSPLGDLGCYFGNALVQVSESNAGLKAVAAESLKLLETIFTEAIQRGKELGLLQTELSDEVLGRYLVNLWNGINITKRMEVDTRSLHELMELNLKLIE